MRPRIIRVLIILALSGFVLSGAAVGSLALARGWSRGRIFPGVACGRVDLGGLTQEAAAARLAGAPLGELALELTVQIDDAVRTFSPEQAGISLDAAATAHEAWLYARTGGLPQRLADLWRARRHRVQIRPVLVVEEGELHGWLVELANEVNVPPVNASFDARTGEIIPEQVGRRIDTDRLRQELLAALREGKASLVVSRQTIPPATTAETLAAVPRNLLSRFITQFNPEESDRSHNVYLGAKLLNGTVVPPGGEFSFNRAVGERTEAAGFRTALEIVNQEFVPGIGGGICQVASTVYNAALEAGMEIIERANHSRPVKYVPLGRDATVVHGYLDLRFRNPYDQPVVVLAYADESYLEVRLLGQAARYRYEIQRTDEERIDPPIIERPDPGLAPGQVVVDREGRPGYRVTIWRLRYSGQRILDRQLLSRDYYPPVATQARIGITPEEAPAADPMGP
ncbi:MAG: VanW family protein [Bacillota bacterium]